MASSVTAAATSLNLSGTGTNSALQLPSNGYHNNGGNSSTATGGSNSSSSTSSNIYRIGDFVYIETASNLPYQVCKIEEIVKGPSGNVEVKAICFYRRRDISASLISMAEKDSRRCAMEADGLADPNQLEALPERTRHQVKQRELFLTRTIETFASSQIRGRCIVVQFCDSESPLAYLGREDAFYYTMVYDPNTKTLTPPERGDIRVGSRYQAEVPPKRLEEEELANAADLRDSAALETLLFAPDHCQLTDLQIEQFITVVKSVGTFARALDCSSSVKSPGLHMTVADASRDCSIQYAMNTLHESGYSLEKAMLSLVPNNRPVIMRDEIEEWSAAESSLFEEAYERHEKKFEEIQQQFLPWKTMKNIIEYYYSWKATDRYVQQKRIKAVENESKLKQVYIPSYNKTSSQNAAQMAELMNGKQPQCESCKKTSSNNWNSLSMAPYPTVVLCTSCLNFWKKFGAFKNPHRVADLHSDKVMGATGSMMGLSGSSHLTRPPPITDLNSQYPCRECNKVFNRQERLVSHMASHRPYKCNVSACGKEFKLKAQLARHHAVSHAPGSVVTASPTLTVTANSGGGGGPQSLVVGSGSGAGSAVSALVSAGIGGGVGGGSTALNSFAPHRSGSPRPIMKTRAAFYFSAPASLRLARRICADVLKLKHSARFPFYPLNVTAFKQEYSARHDKGVSPLPRMRPKNRGKVTDVSHRLGTPQMPKPEWLIALPKDKLPRPERLAFPPGISALDAELRNRELLEAKAALNTPCEASSRKRSLDQNGTSSSSASSLPSKRRQMAPPSILGKSVPDLFENISKHSSAVSTSLNGRAKIATITNVSGQKQMISWVEAPDDVCFVANDKIKQMRRKVSLAELRRAARRPWKRCAKGLQSSAGGATGNASSSSGAASGLNSAILPSSLSSSSSLGGGSLASGALNLASLGHHHPHLSSSVGNSAAVASASQQQQALALLQQQMLAAQGLTMTGPNAAAMIAAAAASNSPYTSFMGMPPPPQSSAGNNSSSSGSSNKLSR